LHKPILRPLFARVLAYPFNGQNLTQSGVYTQSLITAQGCDSIVTLTLTVTGPITTSLTVSICEGESYSFNGQQLSQSGVYTAEFTTAAGCDSIVTLNLSVSENIFAVIEASICEGDFYLFYGQEITMEGSYEQIVSVPDDCDSLVTLILTYYPSEEVEISITINEGESYEFDGELLTEAGTYTAVFENQFGCDSAVTLILNVMEFGQDTLYVSICEGETYDFNGQILSEAGTYSDTITDPASGATVIQVLILSVNPVYQTELQFEICEGESVEYNGLQFTQAGIYEVMLSTQENCDSLIILELLVYPTYDITLEATICQGESYEFEGEQLTEAGTYTMNYETVQGCDSSISLVLTVESASVDTQQVEICEGDSYEVNGNIYTESGIYTDTLESAEGCQTILVTQLTVNPTYEVFLTDTICQGETYVFGNNQLSLSGNYVLNLQTAAGCDSIIYLNLWVAPSYYQTLEVTICFGENALVNGNLYSESGTYIDSFQTVHGCDSIIEIVISIENQLSPQITAGSLNFCVGSETTLDAGPGFDTYLWSNGANTQTTTVNASGNYTVSVTQGECESTASVDITTAICDPVVVDIESSVSSGCSPLQVQFSNNGSGTNLTYQWSFGNGLFSNAAAPTMVYGVPGVYTVQLILSNGLASDTGSVDITVTIPDNWVIETQQTDPCTPTQITFEATTTGSANAASWFWQFGDGSTSILEAPEHVYASFGNYLVSLILVDEQGCSVQLLHAITVAPAGSGSEPTVVNAFVCAGESYNGVVYAQDTTLEEILTGSDGCDSIVITNLNVLPALVIQIDTTICQGDFVLFGGQLLNTSGTFVIQQTNAAGCLDTWNINLTVNTPVEATLSQTLCYGDTLVINGTAYHAGNSSGFEILVASNGCDSLLSILLTFESEPLSLLDEEVAISL
jgi:trimeric autotransporter adhesin